MEQLHPDDQSYRARLSRRLAVLLGCMIILSTSGRALLGEVNPLLVGAGLVNSCCWFAVYWLIASQRVFAQAPRLLLLTACVMAVPLMLWTGGANSEFGVFIPVFPIFAVMIGGTRLCLPVAAFWLVAVSLDLLWPDVTRAFNDELFDPTKSRARSLWILISTVTTTLFSVQLDRSFSQLRNKLQRQATQDPLTGLLNRRGLDEGVARELARAGRTQEPIALLIVDVDHFKTFNDRHGHSAGDRALAAIAEALEGTARAGQDLVARFGGEEFVVLLTNSNTEQAVIVAEKVRKAFHQRLSSAATEGELLTATVGVAVQSPPFPERLSETQRTALFEGLLRQADEALYLGKNQGRDRVVIAG